MIVILSTEEDQSTSEVIDWLHDFGATCTRINGSSNVRLQQIIFQDTGTPVVNFIHKNKLISTHEISAFWYRRGNVWFDIGDIPFDEWESSFAESVKVQLNQELDTVRELLHSVFEKSHSLGSYAKKGVNKLKMLWEAKNVGLDVPHTSVHISLDNVKGEFSVPIITKSISENLNISEEFSNGELRTYTMYTEEVKVENTRENFFPSLIQEKLDKKFEVRSFYLAGEVYSMAIFSQADDKTKTDFRKYNRITPNRTCPIILPLEIKNKLNELMENVNLDTGSIDFVVTKDNKFVFLEVNPVGQFGMVSDPCNYKLEKKIAQYLIHNEETKNEKLFK
ncbi:MAG: grasp-with-spasm system ATP-grasp peptide maturase [Crocinitomix sp.]|nr:grasp-with-spasm system ATP-grasp peptide maturase [Crocinitomix sp.]